MAGDEAGPGDEVLSVLVASLRSELAESQAALAQAVEELAQARERIDALEARLRHASTITCGSPRTGGSRPITTAASATSA